MKIVGFMALILSVVMGFIIYLNYSVDSLMDDVEYADTQEVKVQVRSPQRRIASSEGIFSLPDEELRKKLDQLNELQKFKNNNSRLIEPAEFLDYEDEEDRDAAEESIKEYKESVSRALATHYLDLVYSPSGLSYEALEQKRLQIISYKKKNGMQLDPIELVPLDHLIAVIMADLDDDIQSLSKEDIEQVREQFHSEDIKDYFNRNLAY